MCYNAKKTVRKEQPHHTFLLRSIWTPLFRHFSKYFVRLLSGYSPTLLCLRAMGFFVFLIPFGFDLDALFPLLICSTSFVYTASPLSRSVALSSSVRCFKHRPNLLDKCCGMNKDQSCPSQRISGLVRRITLTIILFFLEISWLQQPHGLRYTLDGRGWKMSPLRTRCLPLCALLWWLSFLLFCDIGRSSYYVIFKILNKCKYLQHEW